MSDRIINNSHGYLAPLVECMRQELLKLPVTQSDGSPVRVTNNDRAPGGKSYMWVYRFGEFHMGFPAVIYECQKGRNHESPLQFYQNYEGILAADGLCQYHLIEKRFWWLINTSCRIRVRRDCADAIKIADKSNPDAVRRSVVCQALNRISQIYKLEGTLKGLTAGERLRER